MSSEKNFGYLGNTFQIQLINQLILNKDFARAIVDVLDSKYFDNQSLVNFFDSLFQRIQPQIAITVNIKYRKLVK